MTKVRVNNAELYYQSVGDGKETIVFSHGYLMNNTMFDAQIDAMKTLFRCIAYDHRGHGKSEVTEDGYDLDNLVTDAISLIEELDIGPVHFVGLSAGGFVGMRVALRRPDLLKSLILIDTSAEAESEQSSKQNNLLLWLVKNVGWWAVMGQVLPILFHKDFLEDNTRKGELEAWKNVIAGQDKKGIVPFGKGIFSRESVLDQLAGLSVPTAIIVGEEDASAPLEYSTRMANVIPDAKLYTIPSAGHYAMVEKPTAVNEAIQDFYMNAGII